MRPLVNNSRDNNGMSVEWEGSLLDEKKTRRPPLLCTCGWVVVLVGMRVGVFWGGVGSRAALSPVALERLLLGATNDVRSRGAWGSAAQDSLA